MTSHISQTILTLVFGHMNSLTIWNPGPCKLVSDMIITFDLNDMAYMVDETIREGGSFRLRH